MTPTHINRVYKWLSLFLCISFGLVGIIFLVIPGDVILFFNRASALFGLDEAPREIHGFYLILAVAYMYFVTLLAWMMFRRPEQKLYLWLLVHAKSASSLLSVLMFLIHRHYLIYVTNAIVDGSIAVLLLVVYALLKMDAE